MTVEAFKEMMLCNEPMFEYNGEEYSICWPGKKYYVTASDSPDDLNLEFKKHEKNIILNIYDDDTIEDSIIYDGNEELNVKFNKKIKLFI